MIKKKGMGMFFKLFFTYLFILFFSFICIGVAVNSWIQNEIINRYHNTFEHQQNQLQEYFQLAFEQEWDDEILTSSLEFNMNQEDRMVFLFDNEGQIKYNSQLFFEFEEELLTASFEDGNLFSERIRRNDGAVNYVLASPIELVNEENSKHTIVMIFHEFDKEAKQLRYIIDVTILIAIILAAVIIYFTSRKMTAPLREMNQSVLQIAKGDFSRRVKIKTKDEIGQLGETFNYMAKELASIDQMRKDFVANVSHDLRSPLTSIKGFLGALMDGTIPRDQHNKYFSVMKSETERLMKLVNDLLDMAKYEANQMEIEPVTYNLSEQIRLTIAKMEPTISRKNIEVELLGEENDVYVSADPNRIDQVLINLLHNATQFSEQDSKIEVCINRKANFAVVSIKDHGLGMNEEDLTHVWERFYKKEKSRSNTGGTGIGLSIVKHIIDLHETTITVNSEVNKGTTVTFTLQISEEQ